MKHVCFVTITSIAFCAVTITAAFLSNHQVWGQEDADKVAVASNQMIAVMVKLQAKADEEHTVEKQMKWFATQCIKNEPGTLLYTIIKDDEGVGTMEIYKDEAAFQTHGKTPHHAENVRRLNGKIAKFDIKKFKVVNHPTR